MSTPVIEGIRLQNILSFDSLETFELRPLNVLIGPNGVGKSNLIEAIDLMRSTASDPRRVLARGGGVAEWIWKGALDRPVELDLVLSNPDGPVPLRHVFAFVAQNQAFLVHDEWIEGARGQGREVDVRIHYRFQNGNPTLWRSNGIRSRRETFDLKQSVLRQVRDPDNYPEIARFSDLYSEIRLFREWSFGRNSVFRQPQQADLPHDRLEEDFSNLGLFLSHLSGLPGVKMFLLEHLADLDPGITDFGVRIVGGTVQVFFMEGDFVVPATRLSDGTLRYLCLLAILCDPNPPPLVAIEEPELGLHPDILPKLADLLVDASERCQLLVTTHSDILVDALSSEPESVVVCTKEHGATQLKRLDATELAGWLEKYRLGELWLDGEIGGTRW